MAVEQDVAGGRFEYAHHGTNRGRLTGAVGSEEAKYLARLDFEIQIIDGGKTAVVFAQIDELDHAILDFRFWSAGPLFDYRNGSPVFNLKSAIQNPKSCSS